MFVHFHLVSLLISGGFEEKLEKYLQFQIMVETDLPREETTTTTTISDDEGKLESSDGPTAEETSGDENLNDDLDFYDFLEAVSDQIDDITHESNLTMKFSTFIISIVLIQMTF